MSDHDVRLSVTKVPVSGIDWEFDVKRDGHVMGTLSVSEGGLHWRPVNYQKQFGIPISWKAFAEWAEA